MLPILALLSLSLPQAAPPVTSDWPQWRGPERSGVSPESGWSSTGAEAPLWTRAVGLGYSSPSIVGRWLYTIGFDEKGQVDATVCLDATTGAERWRHTLPAERWDDMHGGGSLTTPAVAGGTVYVLSRMGPLLALSAEDGRELWRRPLKEELAVELGPFGFSSSPLVLGEAVVVNVGKTAAFERATGKPLWSTRDYGPSYATPEPFTLGADALLAVFNGAGLAVLEQRSGAELVLYPWTSEYNVNSASPIVSANRIFISTGYNEKGCALLELGREGTQSSLTPVWTSRDMNNRMSGCVRVDGVYFGFDDAVLTAIDADGKTLWRERGLGKGSLSASDGRLIVLGEEGELVVARASKTGFEPLHRRQVLTGGVCWTPPVLAGGRIYCRNSLGTLVALDHRGAGPGKH